MTLNVCIMYSIFYGDHSLTWTGLENSNSKCKVHEVVDGWYTQCHSVSMNRTVRHHYLVPVLKIDDIPSNLILCTNFRNWTSNITLALILQKLLKKINNLFTYPSAWMYIFIYTQTYDTIKMSWLWTVLPNHSTQHLQPNTLLHNWQHGYINWTISRILCFLHHAF